MRVLADLLADVRLAFVDREVNDRFAGGHGRRDRTVFHVEDVFDDRLLGRGDDALIAARAHRGENVVGRELVLGRKRNVEKPQRRVGHVVKDPHEGRQGGADQTHRHGHEDGVALGVVDRQTLGQQVRQKHDRAGDEQKRTHEAELSGGLRFEKIAEHRGEIGRKRRFADDTAHDGGHVVADLNDREVAARIFLGFKGARGAPDFFFGHGAQPQFAGRGKADFGKGEKPADRHQKKKTENLNA